LIVGKRRILEGVINMTSANLISNKNIYYVKGLPLLEAKRRVYKKVQDWDRCFSCKRHFQVGDAEYKFRFLDGNIKEIYGFQNKYYKYTYAVTNWNKLCEDCITKQIDRIKIWSIALEQFYMRVKR
jgi:hypothetical protein